MSLSDIISDGATLQELEELQAQLYSIMLQRYGPAAAAGVSWRVTELLNCDSSMAARHC
jgi:hypothetical protein